MEIVLSPCPAQRRQPLGSRALFAVWLLIAAPGLAIALAATEPESAQLGDVVIARSLVSAGNAEQLQVVFDKGRRRKPIVRAADLLMPGGWNRIRLEARGDTFTVWLNGQQVSRFHDTAGKYRLPGPIGLQIHGGVVMKVEFRNLRAAEL